MLQAFNVGQDGSLSTIHANSAGDALSRLETMVMLSTNIPMEARIMALADVYDALVSKRCYKERMSFREARDVLVASMGKQFDPRLKDCFLECQDQLMDYYCSVDH